MHLSNIFCFLLALFAVGYVFQSASCREAGLFFLSRIVKLVFVLGLLGVSAPAWAADWYFLYDGNSFATQTITPAVGDTIIFEDQSDNCDGSTIRAWGSGGVQPSGETTVACYSVSLVFLTSSSSGGYLFNQSVGQKIFEWSSVAADTEAPTVSSVLD